MPPLSSCRARQLLLTLFTATVFGCGSRSTLQSGEPFCGDGIVNAPEEYCDGNDLAGLECATLGFNPNEQLKCNRDCSLNLASCGESSAADGGLPPVEEPVCGNTRIEANETCDDGNKADGDGCSSSCATESIRCGNGKAEPGEACDDGNGVGGDGCSPDCQIETAECGNGVTETGETCDDKNTLNNDGCSSTCALEAGYCGDGVVQPNEDCDLSATTTPNPHCIDCKLNIVVGKAMPRYASAPNWNDWVTLAAPNQPCPLGGSASSLEECFHGGEARAVEVSGITRCSDASATDTFLPDGAFDWECQETSTAIRFVSNNLKKQSRLADLLSVADDVQEPLSLTALRAMTAEAAASLTRALFAPATLIVKTPFGTIRGELSTWWSNPVQLLCAVPQGSDSVYRLNTPSALYVVTPSCASGAMMLDPGLSEPQRVGIVVPPGLTFANSVATPIVSLRIANANISQIWLEGSFDAKGQFGIRAENLRYSVLRSVTLLNAQSHGLYSRNGARDRFEQIQAEANRSCGVYIETMHNSRFEDITTNRNEAAGLALNDCQKSDFQQVNSVGNASSGIVLQRASAGNKLDALTLTGNLGSQLILEGATGNTLSNITARLESAAPGPVGSSTLNAMIILGETQNNQLSHVNVLGGRNDSIRIAGVSNALSDATIEQSAQDGLSLEGGGQHRIFNVKVRGSKRGGVSISGVDDLSLDGVEVSSSGSHGVAVEGGKRAHLANIRVSSSGASGVLIANNASSVFELVEVASSSGDGVQISGATSIRLLNVKVRTSGANGISISNSSALSLEGIDVGSSAGDGLSLSASKGNRLTTVAIADSGKNGVASTQSSDNRFTDLDIARSKATGTSLLGPSSNNIFEGVTVTLSGAEGFVSGSSTDLKLSNFAIGESASHGLSLGGDRGGQVSNGTVSDSGSNGVSVGGCSNGTISNLTIRDSADYGLSLGGTGYYRCDGVEIVNSRESGLVTGGGTNLVMSKLSVHGSGKVGAYLAGTSGAQIRDLIAANNGGAGVHLVGVNDLVMQGATLSNNGSAQSTCSDRWTCGNGLSAMGAQDCVFSQITAVSNEGHGMAFYGCTGIVLSHATVMSSTGDGVRFEPDDSTSNRTNQVSLLGLLIANNAGVGLHLLNSAINVAADLAIAHNGSDAIRLGPNTTHNQFTGWLKLGNNAGLPCNTTAAGPLAGLNDACQSTGSLHWPAPRVDLTLDLSNALVGSGFGPADQTNAAKTSAAVDFSSITDWTHFDHALRTWGKTEAGSRPTAVQRGRCTTGKCSIFDYSLVLSDTALRNALAIAEDGGDNDVIEHFWDGTATDEPTAASCAAANDAAPFERALEFGCTPTEWGLTGSGACVGGRGACLTRLIRHAVQTEPSIISVNGDALCSSGEYCVVARNFGSYLGHGTPLVPITRPVTRIVNGVTETTVLDTYPIDGVPSVGFSAFPSNGR